MAVFREAPSFPPSIAFGATGGPQWSTGVVTTRGQDEQRVKRWEMPLYAYEVELATKPAEQVLEFLAFFATIAQGPLERFRYYDWNPGEAQGIDELIGTGDASDTTFQLVKNYEVSNVFLSRIISKPIANTTSITLNGTPTSAWALDTTTGVVTLSSAPGSGVLIRATFQFEVPVALVLPILGLMPVDGGLWTWPSVQLQEVREIA